VNYDDSLVVTISDLLLMGTI